MTLSQAEKKVDRAENARERAIEKLVDVECVYSDALEVWGRLQDAHDKRSSRKAA